mgnify:CR=1 FL=1
MKLILFGKRYLRSKQYKIEKQFFQQFYKSCENIVGINERRKNGRDSKITKIYSNERIASRRAAETMIQEGRVKVNGKKITEQGVKIEIGADNVSVDDKPIKLKNKKYYIMLNKPVGYVSTAKDQFDRPTVVDLIKEDLGDVRIFPADDLTMKPRDCFCLQMTATSHTKSRTLSSIPIRLISQR